MNSHIHDMIKSYDTIIIHRHSRPDLDAIGSQIGLKLLIESTYPNKQVFAVGDLNTMSYRARMDLIEDTLYQGALVIITDVSVSKMVSDTRYRLGEQLIIIDHHENETDIDNVSIFYRESSYNSACEMIIDFAKEEGFIVSSEAATYLYGGMVTDSGRFMYLKAPSRTYGLASFITQFEPNISDLYDYLYTEKLETRHIKNQFKDFELTPNQVAYRINSFALIQSTGLDFQAISRGMVNLMAGIEEVLIWASFSEDETGKYIAELRSRHIEIVDIAKHFGGGGHLHACGATLNHLDDVHQMIQILDERKQHHELTTKNQTI
jgi:bifunctional oligoribonuclease and PAP phosphatase NrnA